MIIFKPKDPQAVVDYRIDWSEWLDGDTISTSTWSASSPVGLAVNSDTNTATTATVWVSGGTDGASYKLKNTIVTAGGRTAEETILIPVSEADGYILTIQEAATVLRCDTDDPNMLDLLPLVDKYIQDATGHDWAQDEPVYASAKAAARMLLVLWHENPGMISSGMTSLSWGLSAALSQLEARALLYHTFEGLSSAGYICLKGVGEGDQVSEVTGVSGATGDQAANFETVISQDGYIQQSGSGLDEKWFRALIIPVKSL